MRANLFSVLLMPVIIAGAQKRRPVEGFVRASRGDPYVLFRQDRESPADLSS